MCMVSMVTTSGQTIWPAKPEPIVTVFPDTKTVAERMPTPEQWAEFRELVEKARKFDEMTGTPDCVDPEKDAWMKRIEERIAALEEPLVPSGKPATITISGDYEVPDLMTALEESLAKARRYYNNNGIS